jgi:hypothetical protein
MAAMSPNEEIRLFINAEVSHAFNKVDALLQTYAKAATGGTFPVLPMMRTLKETMPMVIVAKIPVP